MFFRRFSESYKKILKNVFHIPHNGNLSVTNLANFCRIDIDMNHFGQGSKLTGLPGHPIIKSGTENDQQV